MSNWHKFKQLSWAQRWLLAQAVLMLPVAALALRLLGFKRAQSAFANLAPLDRVAAGDPVLEPVHRAHVAAKMLKAAARHVPFRVGCLPQSLVLWWLLWRQRIQSDLRIGVRKRGNRFEAHAWVELPGTVLNDCDDVSRHFVPFERAIVPVEGRSE